MLASQYVNSHNTSSMHSIRHNFMHGFIVLFLVVIWLYQQFVTDSCNVFTYTF